MGKKESYESRVEKHLLPLMEEHGFELVDVEYVKEAGNWYLRGYIDKPGGITVNDCETVSRAFSDRLDEDDFIEDSYIMEISSPGLDRPLKKEHPANFLLNNNASAKPMINWKKIEPTVKINVFAIDLVRIELPLVNNSI